MNCPAQRPGQSEQTVCTPPDFLLAAERRFGQIGFDLAANAETCVVPRYYGPDRDSLEQRDSLKQDWSMLTGILWCNPPYSRIEPWAAKAAKSKASVLLLVPASVGSRWFREWVWPFARVHVLVPRLTFVGHTSAYPKDLILAQYGIGPQTLAFWRWRQ